jgi:prevent-host-death family protein
MKSVKVSELKARLSEYLARARRGETVVVCDRNTPIARLIPYDERSDEFRIEPPTLPRSALRKIRGVRTRGPVDVVRLLRESRDSR